MNITAHCNEEKELTEADIVARYGDDALDAVKNEEGDIDRDRLQKIMGLFRAGTSENNKQDRSSQLAEVVLQSVSGSTEESHQR